MFSFHLKFWNLFLKAAVCRAFHICCEITYQHVIFNVVIRGIILFSETQTPVWVCHQAGNIQNLGQGFDVTV